MSNSQSLTTLLDQTGWIHSLARRLVADVHAAEDLVQDTWVDALEQSPDAARPVRGWLATVMRHRMSKLRRGDSNRAARDRQAARGEALPSTLDVVERAATHRDLVLAVMELEEPYRSTLLMRFFEQLSYGEIARRTGATRATVNSRITRGLERLRQRLEGSYGGDRRALCVALAPLAKLPTGIATTILGVKTMYVAIGTAAVALVAVTANVGLFPEAREATEPTPGVVNASSGALASGPAGVQLVPAIEPAAARVPAESQLVGLRQERRPVQTEGERDVWRTELFHTLVVPETIRSLAVNTGSGDIEIDASTSGQLEITAKVRAKLSRVDTAGLSQLFEDHVKIEEKGKTLTIEDNHRNERGWSVSFVLHVPAGLQMNANTGSGDVAVRSGSTAVNANTGSGDVLVDIQGEKIGTINANTGSGDVEVRVAGVEDKFSVNTGSGDVMAVILDVFSPGKASFNTGSGDVLLVVPAGIVGTFQLETHSGDIDLPPSLGIAVEKQRGGGHRAEGTIGNGGTYRMNTGSGDLEVRIGNSLPTPR